MTDTLVVDYVRPHWQHSALVLVDVQADFLDGPAAVAGTSDLMGNMSQLATAYRAAGRPVIHVVRLYRPGSTDVDPPRRAMIQNGGRMVTPGSSGSQIPASLLPHPVELDHELLLSGGLQQLGAREHILYKPRWSAFYRTQLHQHLRALGVDTVVVAGCNLPNCPRGTLFDASERDYRAVAVIDATSQATPERLADLGLIGVAVATTDEVVKYQQNAT